MTYLPTCQYLVYWSPESLTVCPSLQHNWYLETTSKSERWEEQLKLDSLNCHEFYGNSQLTGPSVADFTDKTTRQQKVHQGKISTQKEILICSAMALVSLSACLVPTYASSQCPHPKTSKNKAVWRRCFSFSPKTACTDFNKMCTQIRT